jgi:hypothetical protein
LLDSISNGFGRVDRILRSDCVPIVVFCKLDGGGSTWDFEGEEPVVRLVLERDESAANVEGSGCPGGVEDEFSDRVTLLRCRRSGGQTLNNLNIAINKLWAHDVRVGVRSRTRCRHVTSFRNGMTHPMRAPDYAPADGRENRSVDARWTRNGSENGESRK